jgi:hypothetical protein
VSDKATEKAQEALVLIRQAQALKKQIKAILEPLAAELMEAKDTKALNRVYKILPRKYGMLFGEAAYEIKEGNVPKGRRPSLEFDSPRPERVVWADRVLEPGYSRMGPTPRDMARIGRVIRTYTHGQVTYYDVEWAFQRTPGQPPELDEEENIPHYNLSAYKS